MPKTKTPLGVYIGLLLIATAIGALLLVLLSLLDIPGFWSLVLLFVVLGFATETYTETVQGFDSKILLNHLTGKQRTLFQGMNFKLPWEEAQRRIDLRVELNEVIRDETYTAKDALMHVKYVFTIRPDASGKNAGEKVIRFASFEPDAIKMAGRAVFSSRLSDYFAEHSGEELLQKAAITKELFAPGQLAEFEEGHGAEVEVTLEDVDFDEQTQRSRDMLSQAKSFDQAVRMLVKGGMDRVEATRVAKLMNFTDVSETNLNVNIVAPDLQNLRDVTVLGGVGLGDKGKKGGK